MHQLSSGDFIKLLKVCQLSSSIDLNFQSNLDWVPLRRMVDMEVGTA